MKEKIIIELTEVEIVEGQFGERVWLASGLESGSGIRYWIETDEIADNVKIGDICSAWGYKKEVVGRLICNGFDTDKIEFVARYSQKVKDVLGMELE
jgi:hypothetical protein